VASAAPGPPRVVLEVSPKAERVVNPRLTRRLVELELADFEVPPREGQTGRVWTHFTIREAPPDGLRIELWERGVFYGTRKLSSEGSAQLIARRIALGAAELIRQMLQRRVREARALEEENAEREAQRLRLEELERWPGVMLETTVTGAAVGPGDALLVGPSLAGQLRFHQGSRLGIGAAWLFGTTDGNSSARWMELSIVPGHAFTVSPGLDLALELEAAAAMVHYPSAARVDDLANEHDTWSARATLGFKLEPRLSPELRFTLGPEIGAVLRRMHVEDSASNSRIGGFWLGGSVGLVFDPLGRF
jgi:hypothetical protein